MKCFTSFTKCIKSKQKTNLGAHLKRQKGACQILISKNMRNTSQTHDLKKNKIYTL